MRKTQQYLRENKQRFLEELFELLSLPSISADSAYKQEILSTAEKTAHFLTQAGIEKVEICPTQGNPIVYGEKIINENLPTILVYGHYDVQPPDPLDLWDTQPFKPTIKKTEVHPEGAIFARGAADDKGQFFMHVKAIEAMIKTGELPCNVKFMIEGEEEIGSGSLATFIREEKERLASDIILISDTSLVAKEVPSICVGLRGLSYVEVEVEGANRDMHSGIYGGAVPNPLNILCKMLGSLQDEKGRVTIPGFYEGVEEVSHEERAEMAKIPFDIEEYKKEINIQNVQGEEGFSTIERTSIRPTLDINGMWGGYTGEGAKTIIPSKAYAKVSMRLVPGQNPDAIGKLFKEHFERIAPDSVRATCKIHHGGQAYVLPITDEGYLAAKKAMTKTFGKEAIPFRSGGSIPIVALFEQVLGTKSVLLGFGLNTDVIHSPNENYGLFNFYKGIETIPYFYQYYVEEK